MYKYDVMSSKAEEFINHEEILETLAYAKAHKDDLELCRQILAFTPKKLVLYDISENYMYDLFFELKEKFGHLFWF